MAYKDPEERASYLVAYRAANRERKAAYDAAYHAANREKRAVTWAAWYAANREKTTAYRAANQDIRTAQEAQRRQASRRLVPWVDKALMHDLYALAKIYRNAGIDASVDHIVPLRSKHVCGLHVQDNLTVILAQHNLSKGNRVWPDMPDLVSHR